MNSSRVVRVTTALVPLCALALLVAALVAAPARGQPEVPESDCQAGPDKQADPVSLLLGARAKVTLGMTHTCGAEKLPVDMMFVVDVSNSMQRDVGGLDLKTPPSGGQPGPTPKVTPAATGSPEPKTPETPGGPGGEPRYDPCNAARGSGGGGALPTTDPGGGGGPGLPGPGRTPPRGTSIPEPSPTKTREGSPGGGRPTPMVEPFGSEDHIREVQEAIRDFLDQDEVRIDLESGRLRTGLVSFGDTGRRVTRLSDNAAGVRTGLGNLRGGGSSQLALGLRMAQQELLNAGNADGEDDRLKLMLIYSDGFFCPRDVRNAGGQGDRIEVIAIGVGSDFNRALMQQLASEREYMLELREIQQLTNLYTRILPGSRGVLMETVTVVDVLSADVRYVPDSAIPPPSEVVTRMLKWTFTPPTDPFTITYDVEPLVGGVVAVSDYAEAIWEDSATLAGGVRFPDVSLNVLLPTPTVTPTPTASATSTATSTPEPEARYLPFLANRWPPDDGCKPAEQTVDIALVVDTSGSMNAPTSPGGVAKLAAAIDAGNGLIDLLKFPPDGSLDQATVISFNEFAEIVTPLTGDQLLVRAGLAELPNRSHDGTRIDRGLAMGLAELTSGRHRTGYNRAVLLVTDGNQSAGGTDSDVLAQADLIKALGITLWTVGLGTDLDTTLLQQAATSPDHFKHAPTAEELRLIYQEIARVVPCGG